MLNQCAIVTTIAVLLLTGLEAASRLAENWHSDPSEIVLDYAPYRMSRMVAAPFPLNHEGFRAAELSGYRGSFLVEFLGGSVCVGVGDNVGRTVSERLEEALHHAGMGRARVLNLCQGGATSGQELAIFVQYGLPLDPQVVLSFDGANDLLHPGPLGEDDGANLPYRNAQIRTAFAKHHGFLAHLAMAEVAARLSRRFLPDGSGAVEVNIPDDRIITSYDYVLGLTRTLAESRGASHRIILQPTLHYNKPWSNQESAMWTIRHRDGGLELSKRAAQRFEAAQTMLRQKYAPFFDLTDAFAAIHETVYSDSVHFKGAQGYQTLFEQLLRQGMIEWIAPRYRQWELGAGKAMSAAPLRHGRSSGKEQAWISP